MSIRGFIAFFFMINTYPAAARQLSLRFSPMFQGKPMVLSTQYYPVAGTKDSLRIHTFRFYISGITLLQGEKAIWQEDNSFHLMDAGAGNLSIPIICPDDMTYSHIRFNLGINSATNAGGARGGELDATKGMYWAWHSGYINLKLEGNSSRCATRKNAFEYHLGGFKDGNDCVQKLTFATTNGPECNIGIELSTFLKALDLQQQPMIMTPGPAAVQLSRTAASMFYNAGDNDK